MFFQKGASTFWHDAMKKRAILARRFSSEFLNPPIFRVSKKP
jgi:hypothetical protein